MARCFLRGERAAVHSDFVQFPFETVRAVFTSTNEEVRELGRRRRGAVNLVLQPAVQVHSYVAAVAAQNHVIPGSDSDGCAAFQLHICDAEEELARAAE